MRWNRVQHERNASSGGGGELRPERPHTASFLGGGLHNEPRVSAPAARVRDGCFQGPGRCAIPANIPRHATQPPRERSPAAGTSAWVTASSAATWTSSATAATATKENLNAQHSKRKPEHKPLDSVRNLRIVKRRVGRHEDLPQHQAHRGDRKVEHQPVTANVHESVQSYERAHNSGHEPGNGTTSGGEHVILRLPRSNVCTGQLLLPSYRSRKALQQALYFVLLNTDYLLGAFD